MVPCDPRNILPDSNKQNEIDMSSVLSSVLGSVFGLLNSICYNGRNYLKRIDEKSKSSNRLDRVSSNIGFLDILELSNGTRRITMSDVSSSRDGFVSMKSSGRRTSNARRRRVHID